VSAQDRAGPIIGAASWGAVLIDTERLFNSLNQAREFTVTEDHLKLLRHLCGGGLYWDPCEGFGGAPYFGPKKPYGNSNVPRDVAEIVGAPDSDLEQLNDDWGPGVEVADRYLRLHVEAGIALKIVSATGEFRPGRYTRTDAWRNEGRRA
jgi:hypothetical protein